MAEPNKETVRIALSPAPIRRLPPKIMPSPSTGPAAAIPQGPPVTTPTLQPLPKTLEPEKERSEIAAAASVNRGPKQETARITPVAPMVISSGLVAPVETIPRPLCWALAGLSTVIFLIQIWNYVVS